MQTFVIGLKASGRDAWLAEPAAEAYQAMLVDGCPAGCLTDAGRTNDEQRGLFFARYTTDFSSSSKRDLRFFEGRSWWRKKGVDSAATPGESRHETGCALDLAEPARSWVRAHGSGHGWVKDRVSGEQWHMEFAGAAELLALAREEEDDMTPEQDNLLRHVVALLGELPERTRLAVASTPVSRTLGLPTTWLQDSVDGTTAALTTAAQLAALTAAVEALATGRGLDPLEVTRAAQEGARRALSDLDRGM